MSLWIPGGEPAGGDDLTAPDPIDPESLSAGTTSLGSTSIGSWSASVTVTATGVDSEGGEAPEMAVSGSGAGPYSVSIASGLEDGEVYLYTITGEAADGQVASVGLAVAVAASAGGSAPLAETTAYDYTSDNTTGSITVGGGDTVIYEGDGTTPKGTVNAYNRNGSPTTTVAVGADSVTLQTVRTGSNQAATLNWVMSDSDADFDAPDQLIAVDAVVTGIVLAADDDQVGVYLSNATDAFSDDSSGIQVRLISSATEHRRRRYDGGSPTDTSFTSGVGSITSVAVRWMLYRGRVHDMLYQLNATSPITVTKAGGSVVSSWGGGSLGTLEGTPELYDTPWYVSVDAGPRGSSGQVDCEVTHIQTSKVVVS